MAITDERVIYNLALDDIGEFYVSDDTATSTKQYIVCERNYDNARDEVLAAHPWNEAKVRVIIAQDSELPIFGYERKYPVPNGCLRVLSVNDEIGADVSNNQAGVQAWEVEGGYIFSNSGVTPQTWAANTKYYDGEFISTTPRTWATGTDYIEGEFVTDGTLTYEVLSDHTSDTIANDIASNDLAAGVDTNYGVYEIGTTHTSDTVLADLTSGYLTAANPGDKIVFVEYIQQLTTISNWSVALKDANAESKV